MLRCNHELLDFCFTSYLKVCGTKAMTKMATETATGNMRRMTNGSG